MGDAIPYGFLKKLRIRNIIVREFLAEFLGTFILIIFGDAAFAQAVLEERKVADDVFAVTWAWGVAVMLGVATCANVSGGHINPAVTVAFATLGKFPWKKVGHYLLAQHLGAFVASAVLFVTYKDALDWFDPNRTITGPTATAYIWATYPKPHVSILNCLLDQVVGTGLLMFTALACIDTKNLNMPKWTHPFILGFMISALAMCFGANCMAPLNPARDFATRCFTAVAGYGSEVFTYRDYWWIGLFGPHIGAIVGGWIYYLGVELHWPETRDDEKIGEHHELTVALNSANENRQYKC
ncbi:aquaporin-9-like isoform X1 [Argiope bruennichi]|uniref:aquaporin-9-like isoform X1 n=1 Tax=Argiope bruennichi TaxID=94029 RepID=UPI00249517FB|nr:aquaporin-9-like isoform X1 [Argiope bruennichi]